MGSRRRKVTPLAFAAAAVLTALGLVLFCGNSLTSFLEPLYELHTGRARYGLLRATAASVQRMAQLRFDVHSRLTMLAWRLDRLNGTVAGSGVTPHAATVVRHQSRAFNRELLTPCQVLDATRARRATNWGPPVPSRIPKTIWQTYKSLPLPRKAVETQAAWQANHPTYEYNFVNDTGARAFMRAEFPDAEWTVMGRDGPTPNITSLVAVYDAVPLGVMRADIWRYAVLYARGGYYADIDAAPMTSIDLWLPRGGAGRCGLIVGLENDAHFSNWALAAAPGHLALKRVLQLVTSRAADGFDLANRNVVHAHTGPAIFTEALTEAIGCGQGSARDVLVRFANGRCGPGGADGPPLLRDVCLLPYIHFNRGMVWNLYGSRFFGQGYVRWIDALNDAREGAGYTVLPEDRNRNATD